MKAKRFTEEQIIAVLKEAEAGAKTKELCRRHGIAEATFYNWKARFGGMTVSEARRLKELEQENANKDREIPTSPQAPVTPIASNAAISFNPHRTAERRRALEAYFETIVLADHFACPHYERCKSSHPGRFYEGQLHHLGRFYDLAFNASPLRAMIVGQEYGHGPSRVGLQDRYEMVMRSGLESRFKAEAGHESRNPHMRGTTNALRLLFGLPLGSDHESEYLVAGDQSVHLFDAFALVNYLLCSAVGTDGSMRGLATRTMLDNCRGHFREVVHILEPSIIIVQGKVFWKSVKSAFDVVNQHTEHLYSVGLGSLQTLAAVFTHPSAHFPNNWGANFHTPYLLGTVAPTIAAARAYMLGIGRDRSL